MGLLKKLLDARFVLRAANTCGDGYDVFRAEYLCGHAFVINVLALSHRLLGQAGGGRESIEMELIPHYSIQELPL